jgi:hypothetical protein
MTPEELVGQSYIFEDESVINIIQIKKKEVDGETADMVTYTVAQGNSLPRKLVMPYSTFIGTFGHLFET